MELATKIMAKHSQTNRSYHDKQGYPSSSRSIRASVEMFFSLSHFLKEGDRIFRCLVVLTSLLSIIRGTSLLPGPALTIALIPVFLSVM